MGLRRAKSTQGNTNCQKNIFEDDQVPGHHPRALKHKISVYRIFFSCLLVMLFVLLYLSSWFLGSACLVFFYFILFIYLDFQYWVCVYGLRPFASLGIVNKVQVQSIVNKVNKSRRQSSVKTTTRSM